NCAVYEYKKEDGAGMPRQLHNTNRFNGNAPFTHVYLKKVRYGNMTMYKAGDAAPVQFMFETVFDYGEHAEQAPFALEKDWAFRSDAFSEYRAGFEIRNCRLCKRVLLYHYFNELPGGSALVKAQHLQYDNNGADSFTFLRAVVSTGYTKHDDGAYTEKSLPPLHFNYSKYNWNTNVQELPAGSLVHAPVGIDEQQYQFVDLYSEGLNGILTEQAAGWFYKQNEGNGRFTDAQMVIAKPSLNGLSSGKTSIRELEANGIKQLVSWEDEMPGFFELNERGKWEPFENFEHLPNLNLNDRNCRLIDVDGDGQADLLITEDNAFTWYPSLGKKGFGKPSKTCKTFDEEKGPAIVFADTTQTIFLAGMTGSGLTDIVRIRNGETCYWPNLGYGRFGAKVSMDHAPVFDQPDQFNSASIRLADIDGSGTPDIIYLGNKGITIWFNQQGNRFAVEPKCIAAVADGAKPASCTVTDLLGTGMPCLVWSSPLPQHQQAPLRF
ncbi:MAG TPA: SpvB/TcaC N-terminal domain-containing protein, partial [Niastella sp.]|nr:SpvB/TcaC N-terminal domain-containing protein [Niastella sp.]